MRLTLGLLCLAAIVALSTGCAPPTASVSKPKPSSSLSPEPANAKERLQEERLEAALKGIRFSGESVLVDSNRHDRAAAVKASTKADTAYHVDNTWFKSAGLYRDAILLDPGYAQPWEGLAMSVLQEGNNEIARTMLKKAVALDPNFHKARFELGMLQQALGQDNDALNTWKELAGRNPEHPEVYVKLATLSFYHNDLEAASAYVSQADSRHQSVPPQLRSLIKEAAQKS